MATVQSTKGFNSHAIPRIPTLDGWRGIAILFVLLEHFQETLRGHISLNTGQHGVTVFFVLSGFLITSHLLSGSINLPKFFVRRFFRLMPVAWSYLLFVISCDLIFHLHQISWAEISSCLFFWRNYLPSWRSAITTHFWSLSMEEQFYLVWPVLLFLLGPKRSRWLAVAGIILCVLWRLTHWNYYDRMFFDFRTEVRADALLVGCLLGILLADSHIGPTLRRGAKWLAIPAAVGLVWYILSYNWLPPLGECVCIALLITFTSSYSHLKAVRWLEAWPFAPLGIVSYSVYVWQQYFFVIRRGPIATPLMMAVLPIVAGLSYHFIEQPCREFGRRLLRSKQQQTAAVLQSSS
jgi:peptidoglycan/LPS O-acetylase OafA/YrhL